MRYREKVAGVTGLEPAASGVTGRRSNQLSYTPFAGAVGGFPRRGGSVDVKHPHIGVKQCSQEAETAESIAFPGRPVGA